MLLQSIVAIGIFALATACALWSRFITSPIQTDRSGTTRSHAG